MITIKWVQNFDLDMFWDKVEPDIARAVAITDGAYTTEDIRERLLRERMLLWLIYQDRDIIASAVTQTSAYPGGQKAIIVVCIAGKNFWLWAEEFEKALEKYRKEIKADWVRCNCRPGLAKWLKQLGWKRKLVLMEM